MRIFEHEEIKKRAKIVQLCHKLYLLFNEKKNDLAVDWQAEFNRGGIPQVMTIYTRTLDVVRQQADIVSDLIDLVKQQEEEDLLAEEKAAKHAHYGELIKSHFGFSSPTGELVKKEQLDTESILRFLEQIHQDLKEQKKRLEDVRSRGAGQQAYVEIDVRKLAEKEFSLLKDIQPFWRDWETVTARIEQLTANIGKVDEQQLEEARREIEQLLGIYQQQFSNDNRASQLGTELALNLYIQPTEEIEKLGNKIPIAIINVDITNCNIIDGSHKLGDSFIDIFYQELEKAFHRDFTKKNGKNEKNPKISGSGVVTILGRTRFKIVGVPKEELEKALKEVPDKVYNRLMEEHGSRFIGTEHETRFRRISTRMLAGYETLELGQYRENCLVLLEQLRMLPETYIQGDFQERGLKLDERLVKQSIQTALKHVEKIIALRIDETIKKAAAKAEYLEKEEFPKLEEKWFRKYTDILHSEGVHEEDAHLPIFRPVVDAAKKAASNEIPLVLLYDKKVESVWIGRNYIPEDEFEGRMIKRLAHRQGFDTQRTKEFLDILSKMNDSARDRKLPEEEKQRLEEAKKKFYNDVLQSKHIAKSYDLRFTKALREEAYDEVMPQMMLLEGPQIMTFIELDGFNAFNNTYTADTQDTYYHYILKRIFEEFDNVFNKGASENKRLPLRMTKQGDEIWISYPRYTDDGAVSEKQHNEFLRRVKRMLSSRQHGEALEVNNLKTVAWMPYLIENKEVMNAHIDNALSKAQTIHYIDNSRYFPSEPHPADKPHLQITQLNKGSFLGLWSGIKSNKNEDDFSSWKVINRAREVTGGGMFGPEKFMYSYMLFDETVKIQAEGGGSRRDMTGRVIRLGATIGYAGFDQPITRQDAAQMKLLRKNLNEAIEHVREIKGRGGIHNLEKEGFKL
jgi:GGDEF domain-containing protein